MRCNASALRATGELRVIGAEAFPGLGYYRGGDVVFLTRTRRTASLCRLLPRASDVHPMSEPLVASLRTCGAVPNLIPAPSGSGVLAHLTTAMLPLCVPKPDAG